MKCLILSFAFVAIASAAVHDFDKYGLTNKHEVDSTYGQRYTGVYGQYPIWNQFLTKNFWQQKYGRNVYDKPEVYGDKAVFDRDTVYGYQALYGQNVHELMTDILFRIFDKQVLMHLYSEYQQNWNQQVWDDILYHQGIFDYEVLVHFIRQPFLRNFLVQEGIFDKYVLEQILSYYNVHQTYNHVLFEQLINRVALKNLLFKLGFYDKYFVYQFFNRETYGNRFTSMEHGQEWLVQIVKNPELRRFLIEQGIFNDYIVKQFLYHVETQGVYDEQLLRQLINKQTLRNFFVQHGFVDYVLNQLITDEIYGLNVFLKMHFFHHVPEFYYRQVVDKTYYPEHVYQTVQEYPSGEKFFDVDVKKTVFKPYNKIVRDDFFQNERYQKTPFYQNQFSTYKMNYLPTYFYNYKQGQTFTGTFDRFQRRQ